MWEDLDDDDRSAKLDMDGVKGWMGNMNKPMLNTADLDDPEEAFIAGRGGKAAHRAAKNAGK